MPKGHEQTPIGMIGNNLIIKPNLLTRLGFFSGMLIAMMNLSGCTQQEGGSSLEAILSRYGTAELTEILSKAGDFELQILYTRINRDANGMAHFESLSLGLDDERYFYPASTIKLPVAILALQKLNELQIPDVNMHTPFLLDSAFEWQQQVHTDPLAENGIPTIAGYIRQSLVISDNEAYNHLYTFTGPDYINTSLHSLGLPSVRIQHRLGIPLDRAQQLTTLPFRFVSGRETLYQEEALIPPKDLPQHGAIVKGKGYYRGEQLINEPFDFTYKNSISLTDLQEIIKKLVFHQQLPEAEHFNITEEQRLFLLTQMALLPQEYPELVRHSDATEFYPAYVKFLLFGTSKEAIPSHIRIYNKVGDAYGFLLDNAYITDTKNGVEFLLSAVIHVNANQIYNDDTYEYERIAFPFMKALGEAIYQYELERPRAHPAQFNHLPFQSPK
jgi:hypothetical protein